MAAQITLSPPHAGSALTNLFSMRRSQVKFLQRAKREHGDVVVFKMGPLDVWLLSHPDYIREVLVTQQRKFMKGRGLQMAKKLLGEGLLTSEGEFHLRQRRLMQPAFHRQRVAAYAETMSEYARQTSERWERFASGQNFDVAEEMMRLTLRVAGKTLFDAEVESEAREIGQALTEVISSFERITNPLAALLEKLPLPANRRFEQAKRTLDNIIYRIINERRRAIAERGEDRGDLLSMLLMAQDEEQGGGGMTDQQVRDEAITLFLAGHETTANMLTWTWYLLSQNPEVERRMHAEIDAVLGDRLPTFEDVAKLRYTEMVLAESMRLYPPAWILGRNALEDCEVGPYTIRKGSLVLMSQFIVHHDARWYSDPERFDPERWTPEAKESRPKFAYFPFGAGTRICIGEAFAWMEGALVLATLARRWKLRHVPDHPIELQHLVTLRPKHGMMMTLEKR